MRVSTPPNVRSWHIISYSPSIRAQTRMLRLHGTPNLPGALKKSEAVEPSEYLPSRSFPSCARSIREAGAVPQRHESRTRRSHGLLRESRSRTWSRFPKESRECRRRNSAESRSMAAAQKQRIPEALHRAISICDFLPGAAGLHLDRRNRTHEPPPGLLEDAPA